MTVYTARRASTCRALSLQELESRLPGERFARVHRRALVNLEHVVRLEPNETGGYTARTRNGRAWRSPARPPASCASAWGYASLARSGCDLGGAATAMSRRTKSR